MSSSFPPSAHLFGSQSLNQAPHQLVPGIPFPNIPAPQNPYFFGALNHQVSSQRIKLKRTRQRVDAGEPRNTYSSIPNFNSNRGMAAPTSRFGSGSQMFPGSMDQVSKLLQAFDPSSGVQGFNPFSPQAWAWAKVQQQAALQQSCADGELMAAGGEDSKKDDAEDNGNELESGACKVCDENCVPTAEDEAETATASPLLDGTSPVPSEPKKDRVEQIISTIKSDPSSPVAEAEQADENEEEAKVRSEPTTPQQDRPALNLSPKSKRKQYQPQQVEASEQGETREEEEDQDENQMDYEGGDFEEEGEDEASADSKNLQLNGEHLNRVFDIQRRWYAEWMSQQQQKLMGTTTTTEAEPKDTEQQGASSSASEPKPAKESASETPKDIKSLAQTLKSELVTALSVTVDKIVNDYLQAESARLTAQQQMRASLSVEQNMASQVPAGRPFYMNPFYPGFSYNNVASSLNFGMGSNPGAINCPNSSASIFPGFGNPYAGSGGTFGNVGTAMPRKDDTFSLVMPRKKRSKVTDTRLSKMPIRGEDTGASPWSGMPPTMVNHPLYRSGFGLEDRDGESPTNSDDISEIGSYDPAMQSCTLTPMHLRKAKLMFFFTRYPSSTLLKTFFPDIRFNKNNTAQLVKWFSNFREFYYIQMEKYARQALAEGVLRPEDIVITTDSEIYKVLNQHYNRNNHIQVPSSFRDGVEATLREFFTAIKAGKDVEPSWKKQIYKIIARLDDTIPEHFKYPNFLEQLE